MKEIIRNSKLVKRLSDLRKPLEVKDNHNWVLFSNPRNRKIQIEACSKCGFMRTHVHKHLDCDDAAYDGNKIQALGWEPISEVA